MDAWLFVTCLVDFFFPTAGEATVHVLRRCGVNVRFPTAQTCCGQPFFSSGYRREAVRLARHFVDVFADAPVIVAPSGSCVYTVREDYPALLADDPPYQERARLLGERTYDLSTFLVDILGVEDVGARMRARATYHDSCSLRRGLGVTDAPRRLLRRVEGLELVELPDGERCCGFGGAFAVRMSDISAAMLRDKLHCVEETGADVVITAEPGCLMQIASGLAWGSGSPRLMHLAEVLNAGREARGQ